MRAQSALDGFDPNANDAIYAVAVQADGKILIGGDFTTVAPNGGAPVTRNHIARLNPDGTLDPLWNPNANSTVFAIAVQADGKILVGGNFNSDLGTPTIGRQTRNYIARIDATIGLADAWNPDLNSTVFAIVVQTDTKILAGGFFNTVGGLTRNNIARIDATSAVADSWDPNANDGVLSIAIQADGKILAGGQFNSSEPHHRRDRRATVSPGSVPRPAGRFVRPERERCHRVNRGAGGRQDCGGRRFQRT